MKFALFSEIPVAKPWREDSEFHAYHNNVEQAVLAEQAGFESFWTVEHHFLEEFSHCSNPEVLYGNIAARTSKLRLGYGVRLLPKPEPAAHFYELESVEDRTETGNFMTVQGRYAD